MPACFRTRGRHSGRPEKKLKRSPSRRAAFILARELGYVDVDSMLDSISCELFMEWVMFLGMDGKESNMKSVQEFEAQMRGSHGGNR